MSVSFWVQDREGEKHQLSAPTDMNLNLMEVIKMHELPVEGTCGGMALCASCQVYVLMPQDNALLTRNAAEEEMLDQAFFVKNNSRLACQIRIETSLEGAYFALAPLAE